MNIQYKVNQFVTMLCMKLITLMLCFILLVSEGQSKKKILLIVPYEDKTIHHTHTIYVHLKDKDVGKKVEDNGYKHEWNSYKSYSEYHKEGSTGSHKHDDWSSGNDHKHSYDSNQNFGNSHGDHDGKYMGLGNFGGNDDSYKSSHDDWSNGNDHSEHSHDLNNNFGSSHDSHGGEGFSGNSEGHKNSFEFKGEINSGSGNHGKRNDNEKDDKWSFSSSYKRDSEVKKGGSEGGWKEISEGLGNNKTLNTDAHGHNHNHGGGQHEWHSYSDLMDHHGQRGSENHENSYNKKDDGWKGINGNNLSTSAKDGRRVHWNHSGGASREYEHHDNGNQGALKHSQYNNGYWKWKHNYY